jgi:hypothetical protein
MKNTDTLLDVSKKIHIEVTVEKTKYLLMSRQQTKNKLIV